MQKNFDEWNEVKKHIEENNEINNKFPSRKEVWHCNLGKNIGFEENGTSKDFSRPVLIIKKFNNKMFWVIPLSTKQKKLNFYFNFTDPDQRRVSAILAQLRLISVKRINRRMYKLPDEIYKNIINQIKLLL
ncbi:MAG TPA: type II toxin-antitoxin system PemK/MazF family toxin [Candidatus Paceibacterota bacterium]|nr:type II toxin-antitoxin system PemK/MazF family toxin [Candidatus Paceibacterota bacterium]HMP19124.1 type II toxin-antitoxin system PemK/MazF family toxin [Candidatus Paceibacterota bacterium]